jgi:hypothetical protein
MHVRDGERGTPRDGRTPVRSGPGSSMARREASGEDHSTRHWSNLFYKGLTLIIQLGYHEAVEELEAATTGGLAPVTSQPSTCRDARHTPSHNPRRDRARTAAPPSPARDNHRSVPKPLVGRPGCQSRPTSSASALMSFARTSSSEDSTMAFAPCRAARISTAAGLATIATMPEWLGATAYSRRSAS